MTMTTALTGRLGEELAAAYLRSKKFTIRERNARFGRFEIDIVAYDPHENMVVFVEVKSRSVADPRYPVRTAVDRRKRRALQQGIFRWISRHDYDGPARIDVISVADGRVVEHTVDFGAEFF